MTKLLDESINCLKSDFEQVDCDYCGGSGRVYVYPGRVIHALRITNGLSLRKVTKLLGISPQHLHDIEKGKRKCKPKVFELCIDAITALRQKGK